MVKMLIAVLAASVAGGLSASTGVTVTVVPGERELEKARAEVRRIIRQNGGRPPEGGLRVELADGVYRLDRTFDLGKLDSGAPGAPIVWAAAHRGKAIVTGAVRPREMPIDWSCAPASLIPAAARAHVKAYAIPGKDPIPGFRNGGLQPKLTEHAITVHSAGRRCAPARWPSTGYGRTGENVHPAVDRINEWGENWYANMEGMFHLDLPRWQFEAWAKEPDLWAFGMWRFHWSSSTTPVLKVDPVERVMCVDTNQNQYGFLPNGPFFVFNAFSELDREGEWAIDRARRVLYLWPYDAEPPEVGLIERLIVSWGGLHDVIFEGLALEGSRENAMHICGARDVTVRASLIRRTGGAGVLISKSFGCRVSGCDLENIGTRGVSLDGGVHRTLTPGSNVVENCHIHHYGQVQPVNSPGVVLSGVGNRAEHNLIHHGEHQGITFYGNDHYVGFNIVHDVCRYANDAGALYISGYDWSLRGTVIEYNVIFMVGKQPLTSHTNAIYLDGWSSGNTVRGNIINRAVLGIYMSGGNENTCVRNVVLNTPTGIVLSSLGADSFAKGAALKGEKSFLYQKLLKGRELYETELWRTRYPRILDILAITNKVDAHNAYWYVVTNNVMCGTGGLVVSNKEKVMSTHVISGNVEMAGDPGFVDYEGFDWELKPDSPMRKVLGGGTRFHEMGLYASPWRFSPPVRHGEGMSRPRPIRIEHIMGEVKAIFTPHWGGGSKWRNLGEATLEWAEYSGTWTPDRDGKLELVLTGGNGYQTMVDDVRVTGARLVDGSFENVPSAWKELTVKDWVKNGNTEGPWGVIDSPLATGGRKVALVDLAHRLTQTLDVKKGVPVTVTIKARQWVPDSIKSFVK